MTRVTRKPTRGPKRKARPEPSPPSPPPPAPHPALAVGGVREQKKHDKRERIREAALSLFVSEGYEATTTKAVAERAGVAAGTLFLYASDKADLLSLVMHDRLTAAVDIGFSGLPKGGALLDKLIHVFRPVFRMYGEHPALAAAFVKNLPGATGPNSERVNALTFAFLHRLAAMVREGQERGEVGAEVEPLQAASNIFFLYFGALTAWLSGMVSLEQALDPGLRNALALQIRGFGP